MFSTVQFGGISAFHTRISDPVVGGTYMTVRYTPTDMRFELTFLFLASRDFY